MSRFLYLGLLAGLALPVAAHAAEINESGARQLEQLIGRYAPAITSSGVLKIVPAGDHYEARIDIEPVIRSFERPIHISEMTPIVQTLAPRADGLWDVGAKGSMWLIGDNFIGAEPSHFQLHVGSYQFSQTFDPAIGYGRTSKFRLQDADFTGDARTRRQTWTLKSSEITTNISDMTDGVGSISAEGKWHDLDQTQKIPELTQELKFNAKVGDDRIDVKNIDSIAIGKLEQFWMHAAANQTKKLTLAQWQELTAILQQRGPVPLDELKYLSNMEQVALDVADARLSAEKMTYGFGLENARNDAAFTVSLAAQQISARPSVLPKGYADAVPDAFGLKFRFSGFNFSKNLDTFAAALRQNFDQKALTREFYKAFLRNGKMRFEIEDTFARSKYYHVEVFGFIAFNPNDPKDKGEADVTITARHLDDTVKFLQANAASVPQFGQASFMLLMAKGMGKQQSDGGIVWHIQVDKSGHRVINGRQIGN